MTKEIKFINIFINIFIFIIFFCVITGKPVAAATHDDINLVINNKQVAADVMPIIQDNRTLVPARAVFETLGGNVEWDQGNYKVTVKYDSVVVILKINNKVATVNGEGKTLDVPATIINGRTMIPVRFVAEELGFQVGWIDSTRTVTITSPQKPEEPPVIIGHLTEVQAEKGTSNNANTIVTIQMSEPLKGLDSYSTKVLTSPDRFVLDVKDFLVDSKISDLTYNQKDSPLAAVRISDYDKNTARIVCDLKEATTPIVDLSKDGKTLTISFRTLTTYFNPMEDGKLVVVLDPGHGEATAGKRSPDGSLREYEFNRAVANKMKNVLEAQGIEVILTVNNDSDPSLSERCEKANNSDADIFVSIHANAFGNGSEWTSPSGWEIYYFEGSVLGNQLAEDIAESNFPQIAINNRGIKTTSNLYVIKHTSIPSVLIEHGFYTNLQEVQLLKSDEWRDKVASYNAEGIIKFFNSYKK
ncbi:N-acetylmuramoyl-L-alanine amidase family protein [Aminipila terrae]|uniref:AMIN domain-containing protein n=1 Tax=Aminipila terrae TaxID=2697030 RepID=A0A6P1MFU7_9FIRM|nr:N-acetylmuramoyl-L-alanine amidase family protein [Aminipila terrae]QHI72922.1 AMIN domain-containing protein [Aminipila terrae]